MRLVNPPTRKNEIWKDVVGYEGLYQVSNLGRVWSCPKKVRGKQGCVRRLSGKFINGIGTRKDGRVYISLWRNNVGRARFLHHLVLEAFVGPRPRGMECCHYPDRSSSNCRLDNLRWDTSENNKKDQLLHGTRVHGDRIHNSKLRESDIPKILARLKKGKDTIAKIAKDYGVDRWSIGAVRNGTNFQLSHPRKPLPKYHAKGTRIANSKLDEQKVREIRTLWKHGSTSEKLAKQYGVHKKTIWAVATRRSWK